MYWGNSYGANSNNDDKDPSFVDDSLPATATSTAATSSPIANTTTKASTAVAASLHIATINIASVMNPYLPRGIMKHHRSNSVSSNSNGVEGPSSLAVSFCLTQDGADNCNHKKDSSVGTTTINSLLADNITISLGGRRLYIGSKTTRGGVPWDNIQINSHCL
jgi:hypothetical protein